MINVNRKQTLATILAPLMIILVVIGNFCVFLLYLRNPNVIIPLLNLRANFPTGILTAIFVPDTSALVTMTSFLNWFIINTIALIGFFFAFVIINIDRDDRELSRRFLFFALAILFVPMLSNLISLFAGIETVGLSTVTFSILGIDLGFSIIIAFFSVKMMRSQNKLSKKNLAVIISSLTLSLSLIAAPIFDSVDFFGITSHVNWQGHIFCYVIAAATSCLFLIFRRASSFKRGSTKYL